MQINQSNIDYTKILNDQRRYIESEQFKGYDPYDTLNSWLPFHWFGKWGNPIAIQLQKRNPLNIRPLIGVKKEYNPKAIGLLLHAYSLMYQRHPSEETKATLDFLFNWLIENSSKGYNGYCWGYNFDWASSVKLLKAFSPTIVVSGFIAKGIYAYYQATHNEKALEILKSIGDFIINDLPLTHDETGICFSYSTIEKDCCYNASMLGSELFARLFYLTKQPKYADLAQQATSFVVKRQLESGCWNYSINLETGKERKQIDFHQGYVVDSLSHVIMHLPELKDRYTTALTKGLAYYNKEQFLGNGQSLYRVPHKWPVEIHNQAQGIITFSRLHEMNPIYLNHAKTIMNYTLNNMYSPAGFFYYKQYPWVTIKTPFMRWSQAWMFLAMNELLVAIEKKKETTLN